MYITGCQSTSLEHWGVLTLALWSRLAQPSPKACCCQLQPGSTCLHDSHSQIYCAP